MYTLRWHAYRSATVRLASGIETMKLNFFVALLVLIASTAQAGETSLVEDRELSLSGIAIGDTEASVLRRLGQPVRRIDTDDILNVRLDYVGLTVWLGEERSVGEVLSVSERHCTPSGVCPGMLLAEVKKKYGQPLAVFREDGAFIEYSSSRASCWLQFAAEEGRIASVRAECQP